MRGRRRVGALALCLIIAVLAQAFHATRVAAAEPPPIEAKAAVLMDAASGRVLYSKNPHLPLPQASTTKITTAILALEKGNLSDLVRVSKEAAETPESSIWLEEGEELTLEQLLYALLLQSANDAAAAIAEYIGGTQENFVAMMNQRARELGARNTHYANPHGLDDPNHYSTAYDLALLARYALTLPDFRRIVATPKMTIPWAGHPWERVLYNRNRLLAGPDAYPGATGVKTGYTGKAGSCLVGSAKRGDLELIAVVLNSPNMYQEVRSLLDYGFATFRPKTVVYREQRLAYLPVSRGYAERVKVMAEQSVTVAVRPEEEARLITMVSLPQRLEAPVRQGEVVGRLLVRLGQEEVASVNLVAERSVGRRSLWSYFLEALLSVFSLG